MTPGSRRVQRRHAADTLALRLKRLNDEWGSGIARLLGRRRTRSLLRLIRAALVGELRPVLRVAIGVVDRLRHQFPAGDAVATQLVGHDLGGLLP